MNDSNSPINGHWKPSRALRKKVSEQIIMVTGGTSGIGKATALKLAKAGATVLLVARHTDKLEQTLEQIQDMQGKAFIYACDLSELDQVDALAQQVLADHGGGDVLVNNAGRSIRRSIEDTFDRFHDFQRTMQLNYFGAVRLTMALLPSMIERKQGQIINISSIGAQTFAPRFAAYIASKSALDAFARCAGAELAHHGIRFTTIHMPLVRTPMIAPTKLYSKVPAWSPDHAAQLICNAIVRAPKRMATSLGLVGQMANLVMPRTTEVILNRGYRMTGPSHEDHHQDS